MVEKAFFNGFIQILLRVGLIPKIKCECLVDPSSELELCLDSGDPYLNLPGDIDLVGGIDFVVDLLFLGRSSRVWFRSVFWRLEPWNSLRISLMVDFMIKICLGVKAGLSS